jgi:predicted nuclease of restriction endonuclease-like RecB superfamily
MANICNNNIFITTKDTSNFSYLLEKLEYDLESEIYYSTGEDIEADFYSKWTFPLNKFKTIIENLPNKNDKSLYLRVFSFEHGNYYHEYNIYSTEKGWEIL